MSGFFYYHDFGSDVAFVIVNHTSVLLLHHQD